MMICFILGNIAKENLRGGEYNHANSGIEREPQEEK